MLREAGTVLPYGEAAEVRVIVEILGRAWILQFQSARLVLPEDTGDSEFEQAPMDPHSVGGGSFERRSDIEDAVGKQRFGFHGSQG